MIYATPQMGRMSREERIEHVKRQRISMSTNPDRGGHMTTLDAVAAVLRTENPTETIGEWSIYDLTLALPDIAREDIEAAVRTLCPSGGRYVGGVSKYLYWLPTEGAA
jgi:hypothetical protein